MPFLDETGLARLWNHIVARLNDKISKVDGKGLSTNDYTTEEKNKLSALNKGVANGVAELDENGRVPSSQLPSYVDDVLEYSSQSAFPAAGESGKIYVDHSTNKTYRWSGYSYVEISASLALGETEATAFRGDWGWAAYEHSQTPGNPHGTTAEEIDGLGSAAFTETTDYMLAGQVIDGGAW